MGSGFERAAGRFATLCYQHHGSVWASSRAEIGNSGYSSTRVNSCNEMYSFCFYTACHKYSDYVICFWCSEEMQKKQKNPKADVHTVLCCSYK